MKDKVEAIKKSKAFIVNWGFRPPVQDITKVTKDKISWVESDEGYKSTWKHSTLRKRLERLGNPQVDIVLKEGKKLSKSGLFKVKYLKQKNEQVVINKVKRMGNKQLFKGKRWEVKKLPNQKDKSRDMVTVSKKWLIKDKKTKKIYQVRSLVYRDGDESFSAQELKKLR